MPQLVTTDQLRQLEASLLGRTNIRPRSITEDKLAEGAASAAVVRDGVISDVHIGTLTLDALTVTGSMESSNFVTGSAGWHINADGSAEFHDLTVTATITGGSIDIGGNDTTSFHVDTSGQMWLGHGTFGSAPFRVTAGGDLTATSVTVTGTVNATGGIISGATGDVGTNALQWDASGNLWSGAATYAAAPFKVSSAGELTATEGIFQTADQGSGYLELGSAGAGEYIWGYTGHANELASGRMGFTQDVGAIGIFSVYPPRFNTGSAPMFRLYETSGTNYSTFENIDYVEIVGDLRVDGGSEAAPSVCDKDDTDTGIYWPSANVLGFTASGNNIMRMGTNSVSISHEDAHDVSSGYLLYMKDSTDASIIQRIDHAGENTTTSKIGIDIRLGANNSNSPGTNDDFMTFRKGDGTIVGSIDGTGSSGTNFNTTSDRRIKENIRPTEAAVLFDKIRWRTFEMTETGETRHGVVAQELWKVPELAYMVRKGNSKKGNVRLWTVAESGLVHIVAAKLVQLEQRLQELEAA